MNVQQREAAGVYAYAFPSVTVGGRDQNFKLGSESAGSGLKRYVSFYFTNFPVQLSNFYLRKGFEVCGMLEDVYIARKRNKLGQPYGFVRFSNVRDIAKLTKALNAVCFGDFRVRARVARFDRNAAPFEEKVRAGVGQDVGGVATTGAKVKETVTGGVAVKYPRTAVPAQKAMGVSDAQGGVKVGEVMVQLGDHRAKVDGLTSQIQGDVPPVNNALAREQYTGTYVRSYKAEPEDVDWAQCGVVATIANGDVVSVVRRRLQDAGFKELDLTHLGGDRVLVRSSDGADVLTVFNCAKDFFKLCFSH
jgi:hypothetical protein